MDETSQLPTRDGRVELWRAGDGKWHVSLHPVDPSLFIPLRTCVTTLPPDVVEAFLEVSFAWLCDHLARHDDPQYIARVLEQQVLAYFLAEEMEDKRWLDFGCGAGASTLFLASRFPKADVTGVELSERSIGLARRVLAERGFANVRFLPMATVSRPVSDALTTS
jgi:SAM-dependent methyltransferase